MARCLGGSNLSNSFDDDDLPFVTSETVMLT